MAGVWLSRKNDGEVGGLQGRIDEMVRAGGRASPKPSLKHKPCRVDFVSLLLVLCTDHQPRDMHKHKPSVSFVGALHFTPFRSVAARSVLRSSFAVTCGTAPSLRHRTQGID